MRKDHTIRTSSLILLQTVSMLAPPSAIVFAAVVVEQVALPSSAEPWAAWRRSRNASTSCPSMDVELGVHSARHVHQWASMPKHHLYHQQ